MEGNWRGEGIVEGVEGSGEEGRGVEGIGVGEGGGERGREVAGRLGGYEN